MKYNFSKIYMDMAPVRGKIRPVTFFEWSDKNHSYKASMWYEGNGILSETSHEKGNPNVVNILVTKYEVGLKTTCHTIKVPSELMKDNMFNWKEYIEHHTHQTI